MRIYAHRGLTRQGIHQNSMEAFRLAAGLGLGIETDLRTTSDGQIVLFHDRCLDGVPVDTMPHAELCARFGRAVPTLGELLDADLRVPLNLDVKTPAAFEAACDLMLENRRQIELVSAFRHDIAIAAAEAGLPAGYLMASLPARSQELPMARPRLETIVLDYDMIDEQTMERCAQARLRVWSYGALAGEEIARMERLGLEVSITDRPPSSP